MKITHLLLSASLFILSCGESDPTAQATQSAPPAEEKASSTVVKQGETLKTEYFDVIVKKSQLKDRVTTGNEFADLKKEEGNQYVIIDLSLKNTDTESRMMFDGEIIVKRDGKEFKYETAEPVLIDGWGMIMEDINPGVTKNTKLVYKVPSDLKGEIYYHPARSDGDQMILLQSIQ